MRTLPLRCRCPAAAAAAARRALRAARCRSALCALPVTHDSRAALSESRATSQSFCARSALCRCLCRCRPGCGLRPAGCCKLRAARSDNDTPRNRDQRSEHHGMRAAARAHTGHCALHIRTANCALRGLHAASTQSALLAGARQSIHVQVRLLVFEHAQRSHHADRICTA